MNLHNTSPILDKILETHISSMGTDFTAYRNHCYRVLNLCLALGGEDEESINKVSIAAAFHDLGIWTNNTYDYLSPSRTLAREYLANNGQENWHEEIEMMIEQHHKITKCRENPSWRVEPFRKADWIDVSRGKIRFGLPKQFINDVMSQFPNAGFHKRLVALTLQRFKTHPLSPFPMIRF